MDVDTHGERTPKPTHGDTRVMLEVAVTLCVCQCNDREESIAHSGKRKINTLSSFSEDKGGV